MRLGGKIIVIYTNLSAAIIFIFTGSDKPGFYLTLYIVGKSELPKIVI